MGKQVDPKQATSGAPQMSSGQSEQSDKESRYVVIREGHRVSAAEYNTPNDKKALEEQSFWRKVAQKHSWGEPVKIVQYDNRLHRVFSLN